ncbi:Uncharacterised protein [Salmonella enterica subsp. enterica serovar Typhi]|nr:Uncharacterised protein [Salmonella enterica subsp. enterica serovar Typhi]CHP28445.1 Uncharacterised protein [Salmonella enterica subsp. enterica serovar Typhi]CIA06418.1 Uncharacterised protein [Salmonella enterica subsp. enterica serovar Typhi]CIL94905.1 Uncharacterised protein [Salmonella enterica subsp. enterica serovar Typhi]
MMMHLIHCLLAMISLRRCGLTLHVLIPEMVCGGLIMWRIVPFLLKHYVALRDPVI